MSSCFSLESSPAEVTADLNNWLQHVCDTMEDTDSCIIKSRVGDTRLRTVEVMKSALGYLLLLGLAACVNGELLQTLRLLQSSDIFKYLTAEEQVLLTEVVATAEACKLTAFAAQVGKDAIIRLIVHLPAHEEALAQTYVTNHLNAETAGRCIVETSAIPPTRS